MKTLISSDWHESPSELFPDYYKLYEHLDYCEQWLVSGNRIILAGDLFDALELGWDAYRYHPVIKRLKEWQAKYPEQFFILEGNHDRKNPYLPTKLNVVVDNILFCHGHQFDALWGWLPIYRFPVPDFIRRWYRTPAKKKKGDLRDYHLLSLLIEYSAGKVALKKGFRAIIFGHTHLPMILKREAFTLANSGDFVDSFTWLEGDIETNQWELKFLPR